MSIIIALISSLFAATSISIEEPIDGETYDGDWLSIRAIVENENEIPDSVHYCLNGSDIIQIARLNTDWSTYMADSNRTGYSEAPAPHTQDVLWKMPVSGNDHSFANPIIVDGIVYHMSENPGEINALDASTGEVQWVRQLTGPIDDGPTFYEDRIYLSAGSALCLDASTGGVIWSYQNPTGNHFEGNPPVSEGIAYFIASDSFMGNWSEICALDVLTGEEIWTREYPCFTSGCATYSQERLFVPFYLGPLVCLNGENGDVIWESFEAMSGFWDSSPVISGNELYIGGIDGCLHSFSVSDGSLNWEYKVHPYSGMCPGGVEPTPALHDGILFSGCSFYGSSTGYGLVAAYNSVTGLPVWEIVDQIELHGSIALADGLAFFGEHKNNKIYAVNWDDGAIVWEYTVPLCTSLQTTPAVCDGMLYVGASNDTLYAFGTGLKYTYLDDLFAQVGSNELIVTSFSGGAVAADTISFTVTGTGIDLEPSQLFNLSASPNPFVSTASISFDLSQSGFTSVDIFDLSGRLVTSLAHSEMLRGNHSFQWNGYHMSGEEATSGLYLCRIESAGVIETVGLCLLR